MPRSNRIVVGVEGSKGSKNALKWALDEARHRGAVVDVVTAYLPTYVPAAPDFGYVPLDPVDLVEEVRKMQDDVIDEVASSSSTVTIERKLLKGRAADTLIMAAEGAAMLVVGSPRSGRVPWPVARLGQPADRATRRRAPWSSCGPTSTSTTIDLRPPATSASTSWPEKTSSPDVSSR